MAFVKASKKQAKLRMALIGPSGSGKTYTALQVASHLGSPIAVIDTERGSASKYAGTNGFEFDVCELESFHPTQYINAIHEAEAAGYEVLVIDSLSHAWMGKDGALELVDKAAKRSQSQSSFMAWRDVTPLHNALVDAMLQSKMHIIVTMRAKTEYVLETVDRGNKKVQVPRKIGLAPIQRDGLEYEMDVVADMDLDNNFMVSKTRCPQLTGAVINKAGEDLADILKGWLSDGAPAPVTPERPRYATADEINAEVHNALQMGLNKEEASSVWKACFPGRKECTLAELDSFRNALSRAIDKKLVAASA
jgi:hypothetical protein